MTVKQQLGELRRHLQREHNELPKVKSNVENEVLIASFPGGQVSCASNYQFILIIFSASSVKK